MRKTRGSWGDRRVFFPPPPLSQDLARVIFAWSVLFSRFPYYLRAWHSILSPNLPFLSVISVGTFSCSLPEDPSWSGCGSTCPTSFIFKTTVCWPINQENFVYTDLTLPKTKASWVEHTKIYRHSQCNQR